MDAGEHRLHGRDDQRAGEGDHESGTTQDQASRGTHRARCGAGCCGRTVARADRLRSGGGDVLAARLRADGHRGGPEHVQRTRPVDVRHRDAAVDDGLRDRHHHRAAHRARRRPHHAHRSRHPPTGPATTPTGPAEDDLLRPGAEGPQVLALQDRLAGLGYWLGTPDGKFGFLTTQAVYALQGAAGLGRDGVVGPATRRALEAGAMPGVQSKGSAVEIDISAGTIAFVKNGRPWRVLHTSTGNERPYASGTQQAIAHTPRGTFAVQRRIDGVRVAPLGRLYRPVYFYGGYAVHGSGSIPAYPASHGCARVSNAAIDMIWSENLMPNGLRVLVRD